MQDHQENLEGLISRLLDGELSESAELELNRALIREPELMRIRDDFQKIDCLAVSALGSLCDGDVNLEAVFKAAPQRPQPMFAPSRRGWMLIPGAIAAALLAMVIPSPTAGPSKAPIVVNGSSLFSSLPGSTWEDQSRLARPVSSVPRIQRQTGRDVIGAMDDEGNLYWIEVEKKQTVRWPAGAVVPPGPRDSM